MIIAEGDERPDLQPHPTEIPEPEGVVEEQRDGLAPVAASPVVLVADGDAQLAAAGGLVYVEEAAVTDKVAIGLDREVRLVARGLCRFPVEIPLQALEGCRARWVPASRQLHLDVVVEVEQPWQVATGNGAQSVTFSPRSIA